MIGGIKIEFGSFPVVIWVRGHGTLWGMLGKQGNYPESRGIRGNEISYWGICLGTLNSAYNEKNMRRFSFIIYGFFIKGNIIIGEWEIFGVKVFLHYS